MDTGHAETQSTFEALKSELALIKKQFAEMESDDLFQSRLSIYGSEENRRLARLNVEAHKLRTRLEYDFNWKDPDYKPYG